MTLGINSPDSLIPCSARLIGRASIIIDYNHAGPDEILNVFTERLISAVDTCIPKRTIKLSPLDDTSY